MQRSARRTDAGLRGSQVRFGLVRLEARELLAEGDAGALIHEHLAEPAHQVEPHRGFALALDGPASERFLRDGAAVDANDLHRTGDHTRNHATSSPTATSTMSHRPRRRMPSARRKRVEAAAVFMGNSFCSAWERQRANEGAPAGCPTPRVPRHHAAEPSREPAPASARCPSRWVRASRRAGRCAALQRAGHRART
jgi:hypothetical protein